MVDAEDRVKAGLWGAFADDALAMPVHWVYSNVPFIRRNYSDWVYSNAPVDKSRRFLRRAHGAAAHSTEEKEEEGAKGSQQGELGDGGGGAKVPRELKRKWPPALPHYKASRPDVAHPDSYKYYEKVDMSAEPFDVFHDKKDLYRRKGLHYHQLLAAGESTLTMQLALELMKSVFSAAQGVPMSRAKEEEEEEGGTIEEKGVHGVYDQGDYLNRYLSIMLVPGQHSDTFVEAAHRVFLRNWHQGATATASASAGERAMPEGLNRASLTGNGMLGETSMGGLATVCPLLLLCHNADDPEQLRTIKSHLYLTHRSDALDSVLDVVQRLVHSLLQLPACVPADSGGSGGQTEAELRGAHDEKVYSLIRAALVTLSESGYSPSFGSGGASAARPTLDSLLATAGAHGHAQAALDVSGGSLGQR